MGWPDTGPPQREYTPKLIYRILRSIEHSVNYMTEQNFKNGISGTVINPNVTSNTIAKGQLTLGQLNWKEWLYTFNTACYTIYNKQRRRRKHRRLLWHPSNYPV